MWGGDRMWVWTGAREGVGTGKLWKALFAEILRKKLKKISMSA